MSLSAKSFTRTKAAKISRIEKIESEKDIKDYMTGCYQISPWELSQEEANCIEACRNDITYEELMLLLKARGKSAGARYIAARILSGESSENIGQLAKDWWSHRAIKRELSDDELREIGARASDLRWLGIKTGWQARRFYNLYREVMIKDRVWNSSCQVNQYKVLVLATTPNYNRLPLWVKQVLVLAPIQMESTRVGDIWRLMDCAKAWKHSPQLPKGIAEKIGKLSVRARILAGWAWHKTMDELMGCPSRSLRQLHQDSWEFCYQSYNRSELIEKFWHEFRRLSSMSLRMLIAECENRDRYYDDYTSGYHHQLRLITEYELRLPSGYLFEFWGGYKQASQQKYLEVIASHGEPKDVCQHLFGTSGKKTVKLFRDASRDAWKWASALANGNADAVQKILSMDSLIAWEPDAVDFLLSIPMVSRLRMLQATTFKYRGQVCEVSPDHVRDTGYLWKNIQNKPELGRIRCWFSIHETLAAAFVKELPDEALPIPKGWERLDGLCSIDRSWELEFPKRVATLKYYGKMLNNCVGGYGNAIKSGRSIIFVVRENGQLTHCVEYESNRCRQFYRSNNRSPDRSIERSVKSAIDQAMNW